jgi:hypothetical protein
MTQKIATLFGALATALLTAVAVAVPASATTYYYRDGETSASWYHYGNPDRGAFGTRIWVDDRYDDVTGAEAIRAHARICKGTKIARVQVDRVRLVDVVTGAIVADRLTAVNSGTAPCAESVTAWVAVDTFSCASAHPYRADGFFSGRWADGTLTRVSYRGDDTFTEWCRVGGATVQRDGRR